MISNDMRASIGEVKCAQLVASWSLVQNTSAAIDPSTIGKGNVTLAKIDLDPAVQEAISDAQVKFAQVSAARADLEQAQILAQTNTARQQGYNSCKACQQIDIMHALPSTMTTLVLGNNSGVSLTVPK